MTTRRTSWVHKFIADMTGYNPAAKVREQNQQMMASNAQVAAQRAQQAKAEEARQTRLDRTRQRALEGLGRMPARAADPLTEAVHSGAISPGQASMLGRIYKAKALSTENIADLSQAAMSGALTRQQVGGMLAQMHRGDFEYDPRVLASARMTMKEQQRRENLASAGGNPWTDPFGFSSKNRAAVVALPGGISAILKGLMGPMAGLLGDIATIGGIVPEGLSGMAAVGGLAAVGGAVAIGKLSQAAVKASRALGTVESIKLDQSLFALKKQTRLMFAEIGNFVLPVLTLFTKGLTHLARFMRWLVPGDVETTAAQGGERVSAEWDPVTGQYRPRITTNPAVAEITPEARAATPSFAGGGLRAGEAEEIRRGLEARHGARGFQSGGLVMPTHGGTLARIAEGGQAEAILPMRALGAMMGGQMSSAANQKMLTDNFLDALDQSQELPPLWQRHQEFESDMRRDTVAVTGGAVPALVGMTYITQADYDALTDKMGVYAVYAGT